MARCEVCTRALQTYQVTCVVCKQNKWPYMAEKPTVPYTCALCRSGASAGRRGAGKKGHAASPVARQKASKRA